MMASASDLLAELVLSYWDNASTRKDEEMTERQKQAYADAAELLELSDGD